MVGLPTLLSPVLQNLSSHNIRTQLELGLLQGQRNALHSRVGQVRLEVGSVVMRDVSGLEECSQVFGPEEGDTVPGIVKVELGQGGAQLRLLGGRESRGGEGVGGRGRARVGRREGDGHLLLLSYSDGETMSRL